MRLLLSVSLIFLLLSLQCRAEDKYVCTTDGLPASCGCKVNTTTPFTVNLKFDKPVQTAVDPQVQYVYGGCDGVPELQCDKETAICVVDSGTSAEIASLNNVTYVVNAVNPLNISAIYKGGDKSIAAAILYLVCNKTYDNATLSYLFSDVQYYHFELVYSKFCIPSVLSIANTATVAISSGSVNTKVTAVKEQTDCRGYQTRKILFGSVIIIIIVVAVVYFRKRTRRHIQHKEIPLHQ